MTDALHRCVRCGLVDADVRTPVGIIAASHDPPWDKACLQAALRQLAARDVLIERCRPYMARESNGLGWENANALLADIDGRK